MRTAGRFAQHGPGGRSLGSVAPATFGGLARSLRGPSRDPSMEPTTTARLREDAPRRLRRSVARLVLPGDRRVWLVAGVVAAVALVLLLQALLQPREYLTGSTSAAPVGAVAIVNSGQRLCVRDVRIPAGTGR